jgi:uncharacterized protein YacL
MIVPQFVLKEFNILPGLLTRSNGIGRRGLDILQRIQECRHDGALSITIFKIREVDGNLWP